MNAMTNAHFVGLDQRSSPRSDVYARLPITLPDGRGMIATLVNISADGALIRFEQALAENALVTLAFPIIGKVAAMAVWTIGGRSGLRFLNPIEERDYTALLKALGVRLTIDDAA